VTTTTTRAGAADPALRREHTVVIEPRRWRALDLGELWAFRELVATLATRDVKLRYKQTVLGVLWVILQPLAAALVFAFVFGRLAQLPSAGLPYVVYALAGLLGWQLFQSTLTQVSNCLLANTQLVSKIYFHRLALPLSTLPAGLIDLGVSAVVLAGLMALHGIGATGALLLAPVWIALLAALALGLGLVGAALSASYRDVQRLLPVATQLLMYASPVAYGAAVVEEQTSPGVFAAYMLNPLAGLLEGLRWSVLGTPAPAVGHVVWAAAASLGLCVFGALFFRYRERRFADVI
jgi:lipopolysaccharide transport system permease protein